MKHLLIINILFILSIGFAHSQAITYDDKISDINSRFLSEIREDIFREKGISQRIYYSCVDSIRQDCQLKRKVYFDSLGHIFADTTYTNNLFSSFYRTYSDNKIKITKTHPSPLVFEYEYKTTTDSILLDSLEQPIKFYKNGKLITLWEYDEKNRLNLCYKNPENKLGYEKFSYKYLTDTIIETRIRLSRAKLDTIYNYLIFDNRNRLIKDLSKKKRITYKRHRQEVYFDSIIGQEISPLKIDATYDYPNDSTILSINQRFGNKTYKQVATLDHNNEIKSILSFENDSILIGETHYHRDSLSITKIQRIGDLTFTEIQDLWNDGKIKCITKTTKNRYEYECSSKQGMMVERVRIYDGRVGENIYSNDIE